MGQNEGMTSDIWQPKIDRYVDAELSDDEMRAMDVHLQGCPACAAQVLSHVQLKRSTRRAARRFSPSPGFRQRIAAQVAGTKPVSWRGGWFRLLAAAAIFLIVSGLLLNRSFEQAQSQHLLAELTDLHVANLAASSPVDVVSSDRHTVKPWFQGKVPFSFNLPELADSQFTLAGGRLTYLDHEPGAHLIYNIGAHHISVFIFRDQPELGRAFSTGSSAREVLNFHIESWNDNELRYFVLGDASGESIQQLAGMWKEVSAKD